MDKKSFVLYKDQRHTIKKLSKEERGELLECLFLYQNWEEYTCSRIIEITLSPILLQFERDLDKWEDTKKVRSEAWKKGGRPPKAKKANALFDKQKKQSKAKKAVNGNVTVNVNDNVNETTNKESDFDLFWNLYDKKVDKKDCLKKWAKIKQKDKDKIFVVVENYVKSTPNIKFRKHPLTWLNKESWNDEIEKEKTKTTEEHYQERWFKNIPKFTEEYWKEITMDLISEFGW